MTKNDRLRAARIRQGLTQKEVAEKVSVSVYTYRKWEGSAEPQSLDVAAKLCDALSMDLQFYITGQTCEGFKKDELEIITLFRAMSQEKQQALIKLLS